MITLNWMVWIIHDITFCNPGVKHKTSGLFFSKMVLYHLRLCTMQNNNCIHNARRMVVNRGRKSACSIIWGVIIINTFWANAHGYPTFAGIFWVQQNGCFLNLFLNITPDLYQYSESQSLYFAKPTNPFVPFLSVYVESNLLTVSNFL